MKNISELVFNKLFKVVRITDVEGNSKEDMKPHARVFEEEVAIYSLYEGSSAIIIPRKDIKAIHTSKIEDISYSTQFGLPSRLVIETLNTVYYLDEVLPEKVEHKVYPKQPVFKGFCREENVWCEGFGWFNADYTDEYLEEEGLPPQAILMTEGSPVQCDLESMKQIFDGGSIK